jgi:hypothetical protein
MGHHQDESGEQEQAKAAELDIRATLQELVPRIKVLSQRHEQNEQCGKGEHGTAAKHVPLAQTAGPFRILSALIKTAAQSCTTRFLAITRVNQACHECAMNVERSVRQRADISLNANFRLA